MEQLAGVDLQSFLKDISKLPGALGKGLNQSSDREDSGS